MQLGLLAVLALGAAPTEKLANWLAQAGLEPHHDVAGCAAALYAAGHADGPAAAAAVARGELDGQSLKKAGLNMRERKRLLLLLEETTLMDDAIERGLEESSQLGFDLNFSAARQGFEAVGAATAALDVRVGTVNALARVADGLAELGETQAAEHWASVAAEKLSGLGYEAGQSKARRGQDVAAAVARAQARAMCGNPAAWGSSAVAMQKLADAATLGTDYDFGLWAAERLSLQFDAQQHGIEALIRVARERAPRTPTEVSRIRTALQALEAAPSRRKEARALAAAFPRLQTVDLESSLIGKGLFRWQPAAEMQPSRVDGLSVQTLSATPGVFAVEGFATPAECDHIMKLGAPRLRDSQELAARGPTSGNKRTSASGFGMHYPTHDDTVRRVLQRATMILNVQGARPSDFDAQLVKYEVNGHYLFHHDSVGPSVERYVTMLLYLSNGRDGCVDDSGGSLTDRSTAEGDFCGGETALPMARPLNPRVHTARLPHCSDACDVMPDDGFSRNSSAAALDCYRCLASRNFEAAKRCSRDSPGLVYRGAKGSLLFWYNFDTEGRSDQRHLHAGCAVTHGEKYAMNMWYTTSRMTPLSSGATVGGD